MPATLTVGMAEAKTNFSRIAATVNSTGVPVTVFKNNKPWVEIAPVVECFDFSDLPQETKEAVKEIEQMLDDPKHTTYDSADTMFNALGI